MGRLAAICATLVVGIAAVAPEAGAGDSQRRFQPPPAQQPPSSQPRPSPPPGRPPQQAPPSSTRAKPPRAPSTVHRDWPLRRPPRPVVVHESHHHHRDRVSVRLYLPPLFFGGVVIGDPHSYDPNHAYRYWDNRYYGPYYDYRYREYPYYDGYYDYRRPYQRDRLTWADSQTLYRDEGWAEFTLDCTASGERLWLEVRGGRARIDWAEVVFDDGEVQVVDFQERSLGPGVYELLGFRGYRRVDHVRMVAEATTRDVQLVLRMER